MATKRKLSAISPIDKDEPADPSDEFMFLCLGGGNEVGRSCHIVQYKGKTVMVGHPCLRFGGLGLTLQISLMQECTPLMTVSLPSLILTSSISAQSTSYSSASECSLPLPSSHCSIESCGYGAPAMLALMSRPSRISLAVEDRGPCI